VGYLQVAIIEYLSAAGPRPNRSIYEAVVRDYQVQPETINTTLCRMHKLKMVESPRRGIYQLAEQYRQSTADQLIVAGTLDRLFGEYGPIVAKELERRGWTRSDC
jgi:predicted transcriptional regulator